MAAEWDASTLRLKYGEPLARETFQVRPSLEMVVNYGPSRLSMRGKETGRNLWISGGYSMSSMLYEHVTISEPLEPDQSSTGPGVTIRFNRPDCP